MKKKLKSNGLPSVFNGFFVWVFLHVPTITHTAFQVEFQYVSTGVASDNNLHLFYPPIYYNFNKKVFIPCGFNLV